MRKLQLRITTETAEIFGSLAARLERSGRDSNVRINDLWLAAQAIQRNFKLLTSNAADFKDIPGLKLVALQLPERPRRLAAPAATARRNAPPKPRG